MRIFWLALVCIGFMAPTWACETPWQRCWAGQTLDNNDCVGDIQLMSAYQAKQWLQANPEWRLPTSAELEQLFLNSNAGPLREMAMQHGHSAVLTAEVMQHGNELLAVSIDIRNGNVELQPWRRPLLVIWRKSSW